MQVIKAAVIGMGVLILLGFGLLVYGFSTQLGNLGKETVIHARVVIPGGFKVTRSNIEQDRVVVEALGADGSRKLFLFDLETGRKLGEVLIETETKASLN